MESDSKKKRDFLLPASILIAALLVSISLVYSVGKRAGGDDNKLTGNLVDNVKVPDSSPINIKPISSEDHILGDVDASVKIIEFSDLECPFCKSFHQTMQKVLENYGNKVAWVYRHYPIDQLHSKARKEAEASECANELGGPLGSEASNQAFWAYVDKIFEITPSNDGLDLKQLPEIAAEIGLDKTKFEECLASGRQAEKVEAGVRDAANAGARGTPYSIVIAKSGKKYIIPGALPFNDPDPSRLSVKLIVDEALK